MSTIKRLGRNSLQTLGRALGKAVQAVGLGWQQLWCGLANLRRRIFRKQLPDYVVFTLQQALTERPPTTPWWYHYIPGLKPPLSIADLSEALERVANDPDVQGVLFLIRGAPLGLVQAQNLAQLLARFRTWDRQANPNAVQVKKIVVHLEQVTGAPYVLACAADQIVVTPLTIWEVLGLHTTPTFFKETLAQLGIEMDVVKIAPWKTAADQFCEPGMTPEFAEQMAWLFDGLYSDLVQAMACGRQLPSNQVQTLIDGAPWSAEQAKAHRLVDHIAYEDQLPVLLGTPDKPATLKWYAKTRHLLLRRPRRYQAQAIGVITLTGAIIPGESRSSPVPLPLLGDEMLGHLTAQQQIRAARKDASLAAVVVHVDSRGGSALASDLIWRELTLLNQEKPLIVHMGGVAASGGYYIAAPGRKIVAQRATLTGSIGVITAKPVLRDTYAKIHARRYAIQRGSHANLYHDDRCWDAEQRQKIIESVEQIYGEFKQRVATSRHLPYETLDEICNGRVWTGTQALTHGLIDAIGDFQQAVELACAEANLPTDGRVALVDITAPKQKLFAQPAQAVLAMLGVSQLAASLRMAPLLCQNWQTLLAGERFWLLAPELPEID